MKCFRCDSKVNVLDNVFYVYSLKTDKTIHFCSCECLSIYYSKHDNSIKEKSKFNYFEFEDHLALALQYARAFTKNNDENFDEVMVHLRLAQGLVKMFCTPKNETYQEWRKNQILKSN